MTYKVQNNSSHTFQANKEGSEQTFWSLSLSYNIADPHGDAPTMKEKPRQRTSFNVLLPNPT